VSNLRPSSIILPQVFLIGNPGVIGTPTLDGALLQTSRNGDYDLVSSPLGHPSGATETPLAGIASGAPQLRAVRRNGHRLRIGHRPSLDFDFFSSSSFVAEQLISAIPFLADARILQNEAQTLTVSIQRGGLVKISFFGGLTLGRVRDPEETGDGVLIVASLLDLAGVKAAVVQKRPLPDLPTIKRVSTTISPVNVIP